LALPRSSTGNSALDHFFSSPIQQKVDLLFLYTVGNGKKTDSREEASRACTAFYSRKNNVQARRISLIGVCP
jgi:hypothetical protein